MNIESVRDLKKQVLSAQILPLSLPDASPRLGIAARSVDRLEKQPRTIALGIAPYGKEFRLAVRVQNSALTDTPVMEAIRAQAGGEVDIRYVGRIVKRTLWEQERQRPLLIGSSIGHYRITAGTLGCFVTARGDGKPRILSNNHVLADENNGAPGDAVLQPGRVDGGAEGADAVGVLDQFVRLDTAGANRVDCALATINATIQYEKALLTGIGQVRRLADDVHDIGGEVAKVGRTTDATRGRITAFELDNVVVGYDIGNLRFDGQIEIEGVGSKPFSRGGDSGSLIVEGDGGAVALLFAGGDTGGSNGMGLTYGNPIRSVLDALGIDLLL